MSRLILVSILALLVVPSQAAAATHYVNVDPAGLLRWTPGELTIGRGDTVTWSFGNSLQEHTLSSATVLPDEPKGEEWPDPVNEIRSCETNLQDVSRTFPKPGHYLYQCTIHEFMTGSVTVKDGSGGPGSGASTQGKVTEYCPPSGLPLSAPPTPTPPAPAVPGAPAPLVNTTPAPVALAPRTRVSAPAAIRRVGVRAFSSGVRVRFSLARRGTVGVRIRSSRTRKLVKRATLRRLKAGLNSVRVPVRRLARGRYTVEVAARGTVVRKRLTVR